MGLLDGKRLLITGVRPFLCRDRIAHGEWAFRPLTPVGG